MRRLLSYSFLVGQLLVLTLPILVGTRGWWPGRRHGIQSRWAHTDQITKTVLGCLIPRLGTASAGYLANSTGNLRYHGGTYGIVI
jgi:hypothetical protein